MNDAVSTRLLVIDDDNLVRAALTDMLQTAGFDVVTASNGRLGLELLETTPVDAVITDILMPEQEGLKRSARRDSDSRIFGFWRSPAAAPAAAKRSSSGCRILRRRPDSAEAVHRQPTRAAVRTLLRIAAASRICRRRQRAAASSVLT